MAASQNGFQPDFAEADVTIWKEALFGAELLLLHASPAYYGLGVPHGDGSAVVLVPGFLGTDAYLTQMRHWLERIGYRAYFSGIGLNADCPNILIQRRLNENIEHALMDTERKIHLIGHSLGGIIARSVANQRPDEVASVIMLASPFRGTVAHRTVLRAAEHVRRRILAEHGTGVLPACYTGRCTCNFLDSLRRKMPSQVMETAIYTRSDGVVDWPVVSPETPAMISKFRARTLGWHSIRRFIPSSPIVSRKPIRTNSHRPSSDVGALTDEAVATIRVSPCRTQCQNGNRGATIPI